MVLNSNTREYHSHTKQTHTNTQKFLQAEAASLREYSNSNTMNEQWPIRPVSYNYPAIPFSIINAVMPLDPAARSVFAYTTCPSTLNQ